MAAELSANWKNLQEQIKSESTKSGSTLKRKTSQQENGPAKKHKTEQKPRKPQPSKLATEKPDPRAQRMGGAQSSKIDRTNDLGRPASLALWAEENDISPEDLAEAYGLGIKSNALLDAEEDRVNEGLAENVDVGKYIAIDCEMVGVGEGGHDSILARISLVDFHGRQVYDSYVRPKEGVTITDWRTAISGISRKHMKFAKDFEEVQSQTSDLLKGRILVGHDVRHDLDVLMLKHPPKDIRDTSSFSGFRKYGHGRKPALRILAKEILSVEIQQGAHSSIEDARVAMLLFRKHKSGFDSEYANRFPDTRSQAPRSSKGTSKSHKSKKKRKN
jgi:RNA exonuclease 4